MYYRARYYHPALGRFVSADAIVPNPQNPADFNRYSYVRNNALRYTDPTGHFSDEELLEYGVFYGHNQLTEIRDNRNSALWYWALRAADEDDWIRIWGSIWVGFTSGSSVEYRGQFSIDEGMLLFATESGRQYQALWSGLRSLDNPDRQIYIQNLVLENPDGAGGMLGVESLRRYVQGARSVSDAVLQADFHEGTLGFYHGLGGHIAVRRDRYDQWYFGLNGGLGAGGVDFSITQGNLCTDYVPYQAQIQQELSGWGASLQGGYFSGGGVSFTDGPLPVQYGFSLPGVAISIGYSWQVWPLR